MAGIPHLHDSVSSHARGGFISLNGRLTIGEALASVRRQWPGDGAAYFYVVNEAKQLQGVVSTRQLLTGDLNAHLDEIMSRKIVTIPATATVMDACELFALHRFLALPVVDEELRLQGLLDIHLFADEMYDLMDRQQTHALFETIGFGVAQVRNASPLKAWRFRFPWLLATIASGTACALLTSVFSITLEQTLLLAFFIALVLGLGESVSIQSMTVAIQALQTSRPTLAWYLRSARREGLTASLLGASCGGLVGLIAWLWHGNAMASLVIGGSILLALISACLIGLSIPSLLHALRLDPKIAAGPVTLALADLSTLVIYFSLAVGFL